MTTVRIRITNNTDLQNSQRGLIDADAVRFQELDAIADTGAITMVLPRRIVDELGVPVEGSVDATLADGQRITVGRAHGVRLDLMGRTTVLTAYVTEGEGPVLLGAIPLEDLDLHVDPKAQQVLPNHPEGQVGILYGMAANS